MSRFKLDWLKKFTFVIKIEVIAKIKIKKLNFLLPIKKSETFCSELLNFHPIAIDAIQKIDKNPNIQ